MNKIISFNWEADCDTNIPCFSDKLLCNIVAGDVEKEEPDWIGVIELKRKMMDFYSMFLIVQNEKPDSGHTTMFKDVNMLKDEYEKIIQRDYFPDYKILSMVNGTERIIDTEEEERG